MHKTKMKLLTWNTDALGKNGIKYHLIIWSLPVLPVWLILFVWYIFFSPDAGMVQPLWIKVFVSLVVLIFLHQEIEIIRFAKAASKTAKIINICENRYVSLVLFSNKEIKLESFSIVEGVKVYESNSIFYRLFPVGEKNISIVTPTTVYYISGTTHGIEDLSAHLLRINSDEK